MKALRLCFMLPALLLLTGLVSSCTLPDMQVSQGMQDNAIVRPVTGRSSFRVSGLIKEKGFGFGEYQIEEISRGWTNFREYNEPDDILKLSEGYQKYSFGLRDTVQQKTLFIQAAAMRRAKSLEAAGWSVNLDKQREFLKVALRSSESGPWTLELADPGNYLQRLQFVGKLQNGQEEIEIKPIFKWAGKGLPSDVPLGYEFSKGGNVLASVQTANNGKVWIRNSLSPDMQLVLAGSCGALLLYNKLEEE